ncbi:MAG: metalloenzyme [Ignavibacteriales bacterium]|nr:metalloenzyme [Ignavibacteriales bacterium]
MQSTLLIFVDGVGIGKPDPAINPFFKYHFRFLNDIFGQPPSIDNLYLNSDGCYLFPTDPLLGVEGLPQSGTGQTSIFCGVNAPKIAGRHFGPFPHSTTIPQLKTKNIFLELKRRKKKVVFVNAYPKVFFDYIKSGKTRLSTTTLSCRFSGIPLYHSSDIWKGRALAADITNDRWVRKLGYKLRIISPESAAKRLLRISAKNHLTVYEYFLTDHLGHWRHREEMETIMESFDRFLYFILKNLDKEMITLIICSDHGNLEDISVKMHTLNPALTITAGKFAKELSKKIKNLTQIKQAIINLYK